MSFSAGSSALPKWSSAGELLQCCVHFLILFQDAHLYQDLSNLAGGLQKPDLRHLQLLLKLLHAELPRFFLSQKNWNLLQLQVLLFQIFYNLVIA
jgi:hypothetical protein